MRTGGISRGPRRPSAGAAAAIGVLAIAGVPASRADDHEPRNFSLERFHLAGDRNGLFDVDWAEHPGRDAIDAALVVGFMDDPLVVSRLDSN